MDYKWELHVAEPGLNNRDRIRVTMNAKAGFYLNGVALKALGDPDAVQLMFDRRQATIGIIRASVEKKGAYLLKRKAAQGPVGGKFFYATSFCNKFKIHSKEAMLFLDAQVNRDGILILDLNQVISARKRKPDSGQ